MAKDHVLITGMSGLIGGIMRQALEDRYDLTALNRREIAGVRCHQADIGNFDAIRPAFDGIDVVIHLGAYAAITTPWEDILHNNIVGTYNVFEASRQAGVKRVVFASSGSVISRHEFQDPYSQLVAGPDAPLPAEWSMLTKLSPHRPEGLYGCSKAWGEVLGRHFSERHDLSILCVRIGAVVAENKPSEPRHFSAWCSHRDIAQMLEKCMTAPSDLDYDIFYAVSKNKRRYRDIEHARDVIGYEPQDSADDYC